MCVTVYVCMMRGRGVRKKGVHSRRQHKGAKVKVYSSVKCTRTIHTYIICTYVCVCVCMIVMGI